MVQLGNSSQQFRGINRTICIGLGGTGLEILMRIRRSIVNKYGDLNNLPIVSFVYIDTDKAGSQSSILRTGNIHHGVDLNLRESEKVNATMTAIEVENFKKGLERRSSYDRQGPYDHINLWFPRQLSNNIKAIEDGAKAIRPVGRLAFFHNYRKIKTSIDAAERRTRDHSSKLLKSGLRVDDQLNIFVVGSLSGGTGSGMFLDIAYNLRRDYSKQGVQIVGYLVVAPNLYTSPANPNPTIFANTYAALKELNYYSTPGTQFKACYDIQNMAIVDEDRPPFDYTYLVSNGNNTGYQILDKRKLCNVIAHKIALDFSGELAPVVKGQRDNFAQHLLQLDDYPRPNVQRYLSFGLAAIYFPRDLIVRIALTRISLNLVNFWLYGFGQSPDPRQLLEEFLLQERWHDDIVERDGFTKRLESTPQEVNKTFSQTLSNWRNKLETIIDDCKSKDDRISLRQQLPREFREQFRKTQPGENETTRGIWLTKIQQSRPGITKELKETIDRFIEALLTPNNSNFSIKNSRDWLDALISELHDYQHDLEERIQNFGGMENIESIDKKWRDTEQIIEDIEQKFQLFGQKNSDIQNEAKRSVRQISNLVKHNFDLVVNQEALQIVKDLQQYVQDWSTQLASFYRLVDNLKSDYQRQETEWKQLDIDEMSGEAIFDDQDIDSCYNELLPENDYKDQLIVLSRDITTASVRSTSLINFVERTTFGAAYIESKTQNKIQQDINLTVNSSFGFRSLKIVKSVIKRFLEHYTSLERSIRLESILKEAEPLINLNLNDPYFRDNPAKRTQIIGFKDTDEQEVKDFKEILLRDLKNITENVTKPTQAEDEILMVTEYASFPLRLIEGLTEMQNYYLREKNISNVCLHNDPPEQFPDIIPPDVKTLERLEEIFYPCLAFELLKENPSTQELELEHYDQIRDTYYTVSLSPIWNLALETLHQHLDIINALEELLKQAENEIEREPERWQNYYLPKLREFVKKVDQLSPEHPNYPYKSTVVGTQGNLETLDKEGVIIRFQRRMKDKVNTLQSDQKILNTQENVQKVLSSDSDIIDIETDPPKTQQFSDDFMVKLRELGQMRIDGLLTEEEFQIAKKKLLGS